MSFKRKLKRKDIPSKKRKKLFADEEGNREVIHFGICQNAREGHCRHLVKV